MAQQNADQPRINLQVRVELTPDEQENRSPETAAYAFSSGGHLLDSASIKENGQTLNLQVPTHDEPDRVRVMAGPSLEENNISVSELLRRDARERLVRVERDFEPEPIEIWIPTHNWRCWLHSLCRVPGRLLKRQDVDGVMVDFPVCHATVEVYEVDPFPVIIDRIPEDILERLRDIVFQPELPEIPSTPEFPPVPQPEPRPPEPQPLLERAETTVKAVEAPESLRSRLRLARGNELRSVLGNHPGIVRPILCRYYPWVVNVQKVAEASTDACGRFEAAFFSRCDNPDQPDLYFKAKTNLSAGIQVTLLAPTPVPCYTHWDYSCGDEVTLRTDHPLAQTCQPCEPVNAEGHWVLVTAIGNLPLSRIRGASADLAGTTNSSNLGLNHKLGDAPGFDGRPFGKLLRLRMDFDNSLRTDLNVKYYRVSWRKQGQPDSSFTPLEREVHRHYTYEQSGDLVVEGYSLGPQTINGTPTLFEIPPALPPRGEWTIADAVEDTTSAKFPSAEFAPADAPGKYELLVELFDANGNKVDINNVGGDHIRYYVPRNQDLSTPGTIDTVSAHGGPVNLVESVSGQDAFVLPLHIDNNPATATVKNAIIGGSGANDCGVFTYSSRSDNATFPFTAEHPNGFASYSLTVKRGLNRVMSTSGQATPPGNYDLTTTVDSLLKADCAIGGFSVHLHVEAWATNGWGDINSYDDTDHAGFAIAPEDIS